MLPQGQVLMATLPAMGWSLAHRLTAAAMARQNRPWVCVWRGPMLSRRRCLLGSRGSRAAAAEPQQGQAAASQQRKAGAQQQPCYQMQVVLEEEVPAGSVVELHWWVLPFYPTPACLPARQTACPSCQPASQPARSPSLLASHTLPLTQHACLHPSNLAPAWLDELFQTFTPFLLRGPACSAVLQGRGPLLAVDKLLQTSTSLSPGPP